MIAMPSRASIFSGVARRPGGRWRFRSWQRKLRRLRSSAPLPLLTGGNLTFLQLVFGYLIGRVLIVLVLLPGYFRGDFFTAYALIEKRFGQRMRAVAASTFLITRALAEGVRISAIALVLGVVLGTSEHLSVIIVIALTLLYTLEGGMKAVIWTDVGQLFIYFARCR